MPPTPPSPSRASQCQGFTLVELLLGLLISLVTTLAVTRILLAWEGNKRSIAAGSEAQLNAALAMKLDLTGIAVGTGSACTSASRAPSHVLTAMGLSPEQARNTLRFSLSRLSTEAEIDAALRGGKIQ